MERNRRRKRKPYFGEREEKAFLNYIFNNNVEDRHKVYNDVLKAPFQKMVESILRKYPIHIGNYDIKEVEVSGLSHLIEHMVKFDPNKIGKSGKKTKAFSYCQTIVRNYFKDHNKKSYAEKITNLSWEDYSNEIMSRKEYLYEIHDESDDLEKLIKIVTDKMRDKINTDKSLKKNEIIVGEAIINILKYWDVLFLEDTPQGKFQKKITNNFQKNKILLFLKEQTNLNTKEIRMSMKPYKEIYFIEKQTFFSEEEV
jgi:hypothetical protein